MNLNEIKKDFPIFEKNPELVYLDSAATSLKPKKVISAMNEYYEEFSANVHRGVYKISEIATEKYEKTREKVRDFIGAKSEKEIIYTSGTTHAINLVMRCYGEKFVKKPDKIVISVMEHHSNFVPWQQLAKKTGAKLEVVKITNNYELDYEDLKNKIKGAKIVALTHASNVLGTINDVNQICKMANEAGAVSVIDGAQSVPHMKIDVKKMNCDFLCFSGHKMLGPTGIGILYSKEELLEKSDPFFYGGEMISEVKTYESTWNKLPYKFEAGTQPIAQVIGLGSAIEYLENIGLDQIEQHEKETTKYALDKINQIENVKVLGPKNANKKVGAIAFNIGSVHGHDVATILDELNIAIRSGHHCAMPLHDYLKIPASARASFYLYNTKEDVNKLLGAIQEVKKVFKV
ncbi:MAG: SufS family cysteine desulfurase [Candidatus Micrarchaeota archaeon]